MNRERSDQGPSPRAQVTPRAVDRVMDSERQQAEARYPMLFDAAVARHSGSRRLARTSSDLRIVVVEHGDLAPTAAKAIGEYRLHQYMLAGLYDRGTVEHAQVTTDPALVALHPQDWHIIIGDSSHRLLCYACLQSPVPWTGPLFRTSMALADTDRPRFPVETEYGDIYAQHPTLARLPLAQVRELGRLVRNQVIRTPLDGIVVIEAIVAIARLVSDPALSLAALLGCAGPEVRRLLYSLGVPVAYAPQAPIRGDNASGGGPGGPLLWTNVSHEPGRFWPFAIAPADIAAEVRYFDALEEVLCQPLHQIGDGLARLRRQGPQRPASYDTSCIQMSTQMSAAAAWSGGLHWTAAAPGLSGG